MYICKEKCYVVINTYVSPLSVSINEGGKMKKIKILTCALAFCFIIPCVFVLSACGKSITYTVTYEEWQKAFSGDYFNDVTFNASFNSYDENDVIIAEDSYSMVMKKTAEATEVVAVEGGETETGYIVKEDDLWYKLSLIDDVWQGTVTPEGVAQEAVINFKMFLGEYESFIYDGENKCYVAQNYAPVGDDEAVEYVKIYMENGKLVKLEIKDFNKGTKYNKVVITCSKYDKTSVSIPEWTMA